MMNHDESGLDGLLADYREACPDVEADVNFMPTLWQKIDARRSFWGAFQGFARTAMSAFAVLALILLALNLTSVKQSFSSPSYTDALVADHSAEKTYYAESVRRQLVSYELTDPYDE